MISCMGENKMTCLTEDVVMISSRGGRTMMCSREEQETIGLGEAAAPTSYWAMASATRGWTSCMVGLTPTY